MELFTVQHISSKGGRCIVAGIMGGAIVHQLVRAFQGFIQVILEVAAAYSQ